MTSGEYLRSQEACHDSLGNYRLNARVKGMSSEELQSTAARALTKLLRCWLMELSGMHPAGRAPIGSRREETESTIISISCTEYRSQKFDLSRHGHIYYMMPKS